MQRLLSTFPAALPGVGLLILRFSLAGGAAGLMLGEPQIRHPILLPAMIGIVASLSLGLGTSLGASALCLLLAYEGVVHTQWALPLWSLAGASISLALIGPGAWSVDAVVYGRRRIDVRRRPPE